MRPATLGLLVGLIVVSGSRGTATAQEAAPGDTAGARGGRTSWLGRPAVGAQVGYSRSDLALAGGGSVITSRHGALTGVFLQFPLGTALAIRPELLFALKGGQAVVSVNGVPNDIDTELAYLELPLLLRAALPTGAVRPVLFAGSALALRIGCDFSRIQRTDSSRVTCGRDDTSEVRQWDLGLVGGAGVEFRLRRATMALEARYTMGIRQVLESVDLKNRAFGVTLGLTF